MSRKPFPGSRPGRWFPTPAALILAGAFACWADPTLPGKSPATPWSRELPTLIDQEGRPFAFARYADKTLLVNFIFTACPVACPTQTRALLGVQRALPPALRPRVQIVSVTVDPERDTAPALKRYASSMGVDFSGWSFVTGKGPDLDWLYRYFSVSVDPKSDGQYDHQVGVYLVDSRGRVMQRYTGDIDQPRLLRELGQVAAPPR